MISGQELVAIDTSDGILLKPKAYFAQTDITDVAGCLEYKGKPKSLADMEAAVAWGLVNFCWTGKSLITDIQ